MVMEKENWQIMPPDTIQVVSFAGLVGDGAPLIASSNNSPNSQLLQSNRLVRSVENTLKMSGFSHWLERGNPFSSKLNGGTKENFDSFQLNGSTMHGESGNTNEMYQKSNSTENISARNHVNGSASLSEDENEDLHADFIDEDSQLPSRISKPNLLRRHSSRWNDEGMRAQTGSSLSLLK